ncbi:Calx-beta domain-containing protein [Robiginitalea sp. M366]|uniref:Calx-beta domain-containing protein n=1 Tax=Robiginitalea aestuariiviva TaxID=3036903 RepID=UPI00240D882A|nr:Calx-beta domain-containing protein [Robiginitalea aestuariiviva]MDG1570685.1 Calx-beta domain-containing protein [Robiginitalea aestuariiviva]
MIVHLRSTSIWVLALMLLVSTAAMGQETFRDEFGTVSYSNQDGSVNWSSDWEEAGDTNLGPTGDYIYVNAGALRMDYLWTERIQRTADLTGATTATLSFNYSTNSLGGPRTLGIFLSNNGGASFTQIASVSGSGFFSQNISAYISANTVLRFAKSNQNWNADDWAQVDNVQISANVSTRLAIASITVNENDGTATFVVTHAGPATSGPFSVDYSSLNGTAVSGADYTAVSGTLFFSGSSGETQNIVVPLIDDGLYETDETFQIQFDAVTDPAVGITGVGTATIVDDEIILDDVPLALYRNLSGNFDYTTAGGTFRTAHNTTDPCAITSTSSASLTSPIPAGATIKEAYLFWSHSSYVPDSEVTFEGQGVSANLVYSAGFTGRNFYGYLANVTSIVAGISDPTTNTFDLTDLVIDNTADYCGTATVLGAWSLLVFYEEPSLAASTINLYYGFDITQNAGTSFTLDSFYAISAAGSKATFLSYEGDDTLDGSSAGSTNPEELSITNQLGINNILSGDGGQSGNNAYNSTVYDEISGVNNSNIYGLDLDTYDISSFVNPLDTQVTANVDVGQDLVISSAVVIRVPSNLISGTVFEDLNYPGGAGRDQATAAGIGIPNATVELYTSTGTFQATTTSDASGDYYFGGMSDGNYWVRVPNQDIKSTRSGGAGCTSCYGVQTFRTEFTAGSPTPITDEIGGANPAATADAALGTVVNAQTLSSVNILGGGIGGIDFGFNFNTIVNTNEEGQGSLQQFILNANNLDESGLDIEANALFDPVAGKDVSIFMIPPTGDALGRTADAGYASGIFDIFFGNSVNPEDLTSDNLHIDGRTQTAYSGDTNAGAVGAGGTAVGVSGTLLPTFDLPEIQLHHNAGDVIVNLGNDNLLRNVAVYADNNAAVRVDGGSLTVRNALLGVDATGANAGNIDTGVEVDGGDAVLTENYMATLTNQGVWVRNTASLAISLNHITGNGTAGCGVNVLIEGGTGISLTQNLIENAQSVGIEAIGSAGGLLIDDNSVTASGQDTACHGGEGGTGIRLGGSNSTISSNVIYSNGNAGIVVADASGTGNHITQNSIYANGTTAPALGIDLDAGGNYGDGVTLNESGDADSGPNTLQNFPILSAVYMEGTELVVKGWARPGTEIEFFFTDIREGTAAEGDNQLGFSTDYGEGQVYITTVTEGSGADLDGGSSSYLDADGNTDNTNQYEFRLLLPAGAVVGDQVTATATLGGSTSEFAPMSQIRVRSVITNRRITYRVNSN